MQPVWGDREGPKGLWSEPSQSRNPQREGGSGFGSPHPSSFAEQGWVTRWMSPGRCCPQTWLSNTPFKFQESGLPQKLWDKRRATGLAQPAVLLLGGLRGQSLGSRPCSASDQPGAGRGEGKWLFLTNPEEVGF